jgi:hypothetical protein
VSKSLKKVILVMGFDDGKDSFNVEFIWNSALVKLTNFTAELPNHYVFRLLLLFSHLLRLNCLTFPEMFCEGSMYLHSSVFFFFLTYLYLPVESSKSNDFLTLS